MSAAFPTKRPHTSGSETHVGGKNGASSKNGVVGKYGVLCKNDALERNDAQHNAATARQPNQRRAKPKRSKRTLHTLDTCVNPSVPARTATRTIFLIRARRFSSILLRVLQARHAVTVSGLWSVCAKAVVVVEQ